MTQQSQLVIPPKLFYYYEIRTEIPGTKWTQAELTNRAKAKLNKTADSAKAPGSTLTLKARSGKVFRVTAPLKKCRSEIRKSAGVFENVSQEYLGESVLRFTCSYFWAVLLTQRPPNPPLCVQLQVASWEGIESSVQRRLCCWMSEGWGERKAGF